MRGHGTKIYSLKVNKKDNALEWADFLPFDANSVGDFAEEHQDAWYDLTLDLGEPVQAENYDNLLFYLKPEENAGTFEFTSDGPLLPNKEIDKILKTTKHRDDSYRPWFGIVFTNNLNDKTIYAWLDKEGDIRMIYMAEIVTDLDPSEKLLKWISGEN